MDKTLKQIENECIKRLNKNCGDNEIKNLLLEVRQKIKSYSSKKNIESDKYLENVHKKIDKLTKTIEKDEKKLNKKKEELYLKKISLITTDENYKNKKKLSPYKTQLNLNESNNIDFDKNVNNKINEFVNNLSYKLKNSNAINSEEFLNYIKSSSEYNDFINFLFQNKNYINSVRKENQNTNVMNFYLSILNNKISNFFDNNNSLYQKIILQHIPKPLNTIENKSENKSNFSTPDQSPTKFNPQFSFNKSS